MEEEADFLKGDCGGIEEGKFGIQVERVMMKQEIE